MADPCCGPDDPWAQAPLDLPDSSAERDALLANLAKALGHPVRVAIVRQLREASACVTDIVGGLPLAQSTVSQHLKVLKEAELIRGEVEGPRVSYCLEPRGLRALTALVEEL